MTMYDAPEPTELSRPFWDGTRRRELVLQWCPACRRTIHYPRALCPGCGHADLEYRGATGGATVYAQALHRPRDGEPYLIALVDLDEGARLLTQLTAPIATGERAQLEWLPLPDGRALPVFGPDDLPNEEESPA
jgi:uncharacterized OB-fold protein